MNANRCTVPLILQDDDPTAINVSVFDQIIGQEEARRILAFYIQSHSKETPVPTMLFNGGKGLGKTFIALKVANSLGRELIEVNCATLKELKDLHAVLLNQVLGETPKTILFDEAHKLAPEGPVTTALLTLLNPEAGHKNILNYQALGLEYNFERINCIFATTDVHRMFGPLVNRCKDIYFNLYNETDLFKILKMYTKNIKVSCSKKDLAYACRGRARDTYLLAQDIKRYCTIHNVNELTEKGWGELKYTFGINACGLKNQEVNLLRTIRDCGPISCNNLAIKMGVNTFNIESELEIRLRELSFIESTTKGRRLSKEGEKYLKELV